VDERDWMYRAACRSVGEVFYRTEEDDVVRAKAICNTCGVKRECLTYALSHRERYGVWGGMTPYEREKILKSQLVDVI
jgi:WhiB family redox-sensing transcriptional regulator